MASTKWYPQCSDGRNHQCIMSAPKCTKGRDKFRVKGWLIVTISSVSFYSAEQIRSPHEATHLLVTQQHLPALIFRTCLDDIYHYKNLKFVSPRVRRCNIVYFACGMYAWWYHHLKQNGVDGLFSCPQLPPAPIILPSIHARHIHPLINPSIHPTW